MHVCGAHDRHAEGSCQTQALKPLVRLLSTSVDVVVCRQACMQAWVVVGLQRGDCLGVGARLWVSHSRHAGQACQASAAQGSSLQVCWQPARGQLQCFLGCILRVSCEIPEDAPRKSAGEMLSFAHKLLHGETCSQDGTSGACHENAPLHGVSLVEGGPAVGLHKACVQKQAARCVNHLVLIEESADPDLHVKALVPQCFTVLSVSS